VYTVACHNQQNRFKTKNKAIWKLLPRLAHLLIAG